MHKINKTKATVAIKVEIIIINKEIKGALKIGIMVVEVLIGALEKMEAFKTEASITRINIKMEIISIKIVYSIIEITIKMADRIPATIGTELIIKISNNK